MASAKSKKKEKRELADLKTLGTQLLTSRAHVNNLPRILSHVSPSSPPQFALEALLSLHSFFAPVVPELPSAGPSAPKKGEDEPELIYRSWLRSKFEEFVKRLIEICVSSESDETLKEVVLDTIMEFVKIGNAGGFYSALYHRLLQNIVMSKMEGEFLVNLLASKFMNYIDVRYFTYISVENIVRTLEAKNSSGEKDEATDGNDDGESNKSIELCIRKTLSILSNIPPPRSSEEKSDFAMWSNSDDGQKSSKKNRNLLSAEKLSKKMKLKFSKAWISFLWLPLPLDVYKEVLVNLHQTVIPYLSKPAILCDFLTRSYDIGGVISVMALSGLFILMTQHGLEYPNFYEKLYALLVPSVFMAKHRAKFFELLDLCLKSPLLPAYLAASFAKKLSRLALSAPPSGALIIIALIHNLLRRHPSINCLVHRVDGDGTKEDASDVEKLSENAQDPSTNDKSDKRPGVDHFDNETLDPSKTNAMRSSLWEIDTLRHHYSPPVSRFVLSLENDLTVRAKTTEIAVKDFSSGSYATIFGEEMRKRVKQVPTAFYKTTPALFSESDFPGWTFKGVNGRKNVEDDENEPAKRQRIECS
uniref:CCAAT-binding factor domain-containing protein n=1 Tax=Kalanchoe fedtschenkoi TaxID=63787 RepID=A0A7N0TH16_KALFE